MVVETGNKTQGKVDVIGNKGPVFEEEGIIRQGREGSRGHVWKRESQRLTLGEVLRGKLETKHREGL